MNVLILKTVTELPHENHTNTIDFMRLLTLKEKFLHTHTHTNIIKPSTLFFFLDTHRQHGFPPSLPAVALVWPLLLGDMIPVAIEDSPVRKLSLRLHRTNKRTTLHYNPHWQEGLHYILGHHQNPRKNHLQLRRTSTEFKLVGFGAGF